MKTKLIYCLLTVLAISFLAACSDFEEININPTAANADQVQVEYFINNSIVGAQMDPHIAERAFVLYWKAAGRMDRTNTLPVGSYNDGWSSDYFRYVSDWLNNSYSAIEIADQQIESGQFKEYTNNLKQVARIWRAYLLSEMTDNFGPLPINGFQGVNPDFDSVEDVYSFLLTELADAVGQIDASISVPNTIQDLDPAYSYNFTKWVQYGNSMRMRLAMRLSETDPGTAQQHFEAAAGTNQFIATLDDNFAVQETGGWSALTGVMTREWNMQYLSPTMNNLMIGLGGVPSEVQLADSLLQYIKPANYLGARYEDHFTTMTNDPSAGYWFDGLHQTIDPRSYVQFPIPGDFANPEMNRYPSWSLGTTGETVRNLVTDDGNTVVKEIDAAFTWNAPSIGNWGDKGSKNQVYSHAGAVPRLANSFRNGTSKRIFFGSWESYFLIAEAAVRGWSVPMSGQEAYEEGIKQSFAYWDVTDFVTTYLTSEDYNRVGTSVAWNHTAEPPATVTMDYVNGYTDEAGTVEFSYPDNDLYENGNVKNDALTKIMTQKFIAQSPWLPLETWNDHRRLGLPFFENPAVEKSLPNLPALNSSNFMESRWEFFPQRLPYPSNLESNVPEGYSQAVNFLNGPDEVSTPLWWSGEQQ
ncbi:SusD/RagB family nutrient-binding outer membrane lipoprotein [Membranicola marinus]|uniref:SusD/RagB family nutrient-binding outer membrane lipoprotein n=1 Tax=Membranihabitans marinus TaxID=1227546 RepID=A0A953LA90_9BACT|nr:SusD/RagB family nutrient-binding outer membrane lipoprotein [Membranihabitans marinus]MBY5957371.1 SusD/RagB family nutrient-binding outer membrane lipoprotein [Membranihabitans marinus]